MTDIVSLRTLFVSDSESEAHLVRQGAGRTSLPVDFSHITQAAVSRIGMADVDLVLIDEAVTPSTRTAVVQAAKASSRPPVTLLLVTNPAHTPDVSDAVPDGLLAKPNSADAATQALARCSRLRVPSRVLVVDDSSTMRGIVRKILSGSRFPLDIAEAAEGFAALREIGLGNVDFVMLDYNMPGLNGIETLSEIKRLNPRVEVVMISATPDEDIAQKARTAGAAAFLKKPFYPADIDAILHRIFGLQAQR